MRVNANISALNAARNLSVSQSGLEKSLEKLSSGYRINRAADDAAGLAISEGLRSEIRGNTQAQRNAQDGISFIQTAEGALTEVHSMLQRMRELAVQASNTATSSGVAENAEYQALATEIGNIGARTKFSGKDVFKAAQVVFQVGANAGETATVTTGLMISALAGTTGGAASVTGWDGTDATTLAASVGSLLATRRRVSGYHAHEHDHREGFDGSWRDGCGTEHSRAHGCQPWCGRRELDGVGVTSA